MKRCFRSPKSLVALLVAIAVALSLNGAALAQQVPSVSAVRLADDPRRGVP